jgi:hypothetical protein
MQLWEIARWVFDSLNYQQESGRSQRNCEMSSKYVCLFSHVPFPRCVTFALQILKHATLFFSRSTLNLVTVIPAMDLIDKRLTTDSLNQSKYDISIRAALGLAKKTLNRYYNMTDWSELYRIAMGKFLIL